VKITITAPSIATGSGAFILADDSIAQVVGINWNLGAGGPVFEKGFLNGISYELRRASIFRGAFAYRAPSYNASTRFTFITHRVHDKVENCLGFIQSHPQSVPIQGEITLSHRSNSGSFSAYLPNALLVSATCTDQIGVKNKFQYTFEAANAWQTTP
jgi:hypothetical protein